MIVDNILYLLGGLNKDDDPFPAVFTAPLNSLSRHKLKWSTNQDTPWCRSTTVSVNGMHLLIVGGSKKIGNEDAFLLIFSSSTKFLIAGKPYRSHSISKMVNRCS